MSVLSSAVGRGNRSYAKLIRTVVHPCSVTTLIDILPALKGEAFSSHFL